MAYAATGRNPQMTAEQARDRGLISGSRYREMTSGSSSSSGGATKPAGAGGVDFAKTEAAIDALPGAPLDEAALSRLSARFSGMANRQANASVAGAARETGGAGGLFRLLAQTARGGAAADAATADTQLRATNAQQGADAARENARIRMALDSMRSGQGLAYAQMAQQASQFNQNNRLQWANMEMQGQQNQQNDFLQRMQLLLQTNGTQAGGQAANMLFPGFYPKNPMGGGLMNIGGGTRPGQYSWL